MATFEVLSPLEAMELGIGLLGLGQTFTAHGPLQVHLTDPELAMVFNALDKDSSGTVTLPEMQETLLEWRAIRAARAAQNRTPSYGHHKAVHALIDLYRTIEPLLEQLGLPEEASHIAELRDEAEPIVYVMGALAKPGAPEPQGVYEALCHHAGQVEALVPRMNAIGIGELQGVRDLRYPCRAKGAC